MKKIQFRMSLITLIFLVISCRNNQHDMSFSIQLYKPDAQIGNEIVYTSSGEYSPYDDDVIELCVPLYEGILHFGNKTFKGKLHQFPVSHPHSIDFIITTDEKNWEDYIDTLRNFEKENLYFSIQGQPCFENLKVKSVTENDFSYAYRLNYLVGCNIAFENFYIKDFEFIIRNKQGKL